MSTKTTTTLLIIGLMAVLSIAAVSSIVAPALAVPTGKGNPPSSACATQAGPGGGTARECGQAHAPIAPGPP